MVVKVRRAGVHSFCSRRGRRVWVCHEFEIMLVLISIKLRCTFGSLWARKSALADKASWLLT